MSLLSQIISGLSGNDEDKAVTLPCTNCESSCKVYPEACEECKPYKTQLVDALYNVEHIEAFYDRYEIIADASAPVGTTECPYCGAPATAAVCEFCGSRLAESTGKIQVKSASEIPNPIIEARNLIYERRTVIDKYTDSSDSGSSGILGAIVSALTGEDNSENSLGTAMTEPEIKAMAEKYGVSVKDYLEGLDMGTYLTKTAYENWETASSQTAPVSTGAGIALGVAGVGSTIGMFSGNSQGQRPPQHAPGPMQHNMGSQGMRPQQGSRPPMGNQGMRPQQGNRPQTGNQGARPQQSNRPQTGNQGQLRRDDNPQQGGRPSGHAPSGGRPGQGGRGSNGGRSKK